MFNWVCWIAPDNTVRVLPLGAVCNADVSSQIVNQIFGLVSFSLGETITSVPILVSVEALAFRSSPLIGMRSHILAARKLASAPFPPRC